MPTVKITLDSSTHARLVAKRKKEGSPSVQAYLLKLAGEYSDELRANEIVDRAMKKASKKPVQSEFRLQDLFSSQQWDRYPKGARLRAGKMFKAKVDAAVDGIRASRKSASNHQYYCKSGIS